MLIMGAAAFRRFVPHHLTLQDAQTTLLFWKMNPPNGAKKKKKERNAMPPTESALRPPARLARYGPLLQAPRGRLNPGREERQRSSRTHTHPFRFRRCISEATVAEKFQLVFCT